MRKVGGKTTTRDKGAGAHNRKIGVNHLQRLHGERTVQIAVALAQRAAQHDDVDRGHALVDVIGDGNVRRDDGDAVALVEQADKFERRGARVDEQRVSVADELNSALRDGLLGGNVDVNAPVLRGDGQALVKRHGTAMRTAQLAGLGEGVQVGAGRDGGHAKGLGDFCYLNRGIVLEHFHDGGAALVGESTGCCVGHGSSILSQICRNCVDSIFVHFLFE